MSGATRVPLPMPAEFAGLVTLRAGGAYRVDDTSVALALLATSSKAGGWTAVVGIADLGVEAMAEAGLNLDRTIVVPQPGELWLETVAALIDVVPAVWLHPTTAVRPQTASRLAGRLRKRATTLLVHGEWPGCEARLSIEGSRWFGVDEGHGHLRSRQVTVTCRRPGAPERRVRLWLPSETAALLAADPQIVPAVVQEVG